jgi:beta-N-acetylhexosaminidase
MKRLPAPYSYYELEQKSGKDAALQAIKTDAACSAAEIRDIGITLNLAPVVETLTPMNRAFLATRSYGPDSAFIGTAATAFVEAMQEAGVGCALKHFPGSGNADPHEATPTMSLDATEMDAALGPFRAVFAEARPVAVMLSHAVVPAWDAEHNASLSRVAVKKLRGLGFDGVIIADDFAMKAVKEPLDQAAVQALAAGVDMVMTWPPTIGALHQALLSALRSGRLSRALLEEAATRIIEQKKRLSLFR